VFDQNTPAPSAPRSSVFCSPIDAAFIFLSSIFLLIVFLWLVGRQIVGDMPPVAAKVVGNIWSTAIVGGGAAGMLAVRKWQTSS
jgi:hypothetical protein